MKRAALRDEPEQDIIDLAKNGSGDAFTELVRRYEDTVYKFSYKVCRDREKAEETLQDTFISVYRKLGSFDGKSKFSTWLYTVVTNNCLMKRRRSKRSELVESLESYDHPGEEGGPGGRHIEIARWNETPADLLVNKELRNILEKTIKKLPEDYRVVFVMRDIEEKSNEETARILGLSVEATKSRLRRARAFLRAQLDPYFRSTGEATP
jgi:RNA polymerase sigma-70 factor, ECF subfamily